MEKDSSPILQVEHLKVVSANQKALVRDVSLKIMPGEIVGLVGESGSGKSISVMAMTGLLPDGISIDSGHVRFKGQEITHFSKKQRQNINGKLIGLIHQDASQALNPLRKIGWQIGEVLAIHSQMSRAEIKARVLGTMKAVNLSDAEELYNRYPYQLSGGQRQRVLIAMAIINNPELLIADEPTTALDVTVQAQILKLIKLINQSKNSSILYISHDLSTVKKLCDRVYVLYAGIPVEVGTAEQIIENPCHVYTKALLACIPTPDKKGQALLKMRPKLRDLRGPIEDCPFLDRCSRAFEPCREAMPDMFKIEEQHFAACYDALHNTADSIDPFSYPERNSASAKEAADAE